MIWLDYSEARKLLSSLPTGRKVKFSPDLGISWDYALVSSSIVLPDGQTVSASDLKIISRDKDHVYIIKDNQIFKAAISSGGHTYKLTPTNGAPTHEIDGIRMHRVTGTSPEKVAKDVASLLGITRRDTVLDICTGMGYTAQEAARRGARVVTIEKDENVLELARLNPWSKPFFDYLEKGRIKLIVGDAFEEIANLDVGRFSAIIHDPPRFGLAGELYSLEFYKRMAAVAKRGCRLFHYTGSPGRRFRGKAIYKGVMERLREAGWRDARRITRLQGIFARL